MNIQEVIRTIIQRERGVTLDQTLVAPFLERVASVSLIG